MKRNYINNNIILQPSDTNNSDTVGELLIKNLSKKAVIIPMF